MSEPKLYKVADVYIVQQDEQFVGVELGFNPDTITNQQGACTSLDFMRGALQSSYWITKTIGRVENKDAQTDTTPKRNGSEDTETPPNPSVGEVQDTKSVSESDGTDTRTDKQTS
tara:strand:- start:213 stop:557 length:345 start_codon:yes stop_codon:yes gene_type:complete